MYLKQISSLVAGLGNQFNKHGHNFAEIGTLVGAIFMADPSSSLLKLFINLKMVNLLGMVNAYYGELLEPFLIEAGKTYFPKTKISEEN